MLHYEDIGSSPVAAVTEIVVSLELAASRAEVKVPMVVDTGADRSCIPEATIDKLKAQLGHPDLPYEHVRAMSFRGRQSILRQYLLTTAPDGLGRGQEFPFVAFDTPIGLLGRDILNLHLICLDGPRECWSVDDSGTK